VPRGDVGGWRVAGGGARPSLRRHFLRARPNKNRRSYYARAVNEFVAARRAASRQKGRGESLGRAKRKTRGEEVGRWG
jgi:hypothetical protein